MMAHNFLARATVAQSANCDEINESMVFWGDISMNGKLQRIDAIEINAHAGAPGPGVTWSVTFPCPCALFLEDMGWSVSERLSGRNLNWVAYGMRKENKDGKPILVIRFADHENPPTVPANPPDINLKHIAAFLRNPMQ
jgi:hypothetical protein